MNDPTQKTSALIVDASATYRSVLRRAFSPTRFDLFEEETGEGAIRRALELQPRIITLSVSLADADGIDICSAIAKDPRLPQTSVVMVTSSDSPEERLKAFEAGAVRFVSKSDPLAELSLYLEDIQRTRERLDGACILVVDDSPFIRATVSRELTAHGAQVVCADGAQAALESLQNHEVDIIITDYHMPEIDGIELVRRVRDLRDYQSAPVLFLSASNQRDVIVRALDAGANDFIRKPFEAAELLARIRSFARISDLTKKLHHLATVDELTQMLNRREVMARLQEAWVDARKNESELGCIIADIDHFKRVNDTFGHAAGDSLLQQVSRRIKEHQKDQWVCGRIGGEEFLVLCPNCDIQKTHQRAESLRAAIADHPFDIAMRPHQISISAGVAGATPDMQGIHQLLHYADEALYQAKNAGRNRVERFDCCVTD